MLRQAQLGPSCTIPLFSTTANAVKNHRQGDTSCDGFGQAIKTAIRYLSPARRNVVSRTIKPTSSGFLAEAKVHWEENYFHFGEIGLCCRPHLTTSTPAGKQVWPKIRQSRSATLQSHV